MNKFNKLYNEYIEKPVLTFENKEIDLCIKREDFLYILEYGKKLEQVLNNVKEDLIKTKKYNKVNDNNYINIDLDHLDYLLEILEGIE